MRRSACRNTTETPNIVNLSACFPPPTLNSSLFQDTFRHTLQISDQIPPDLAECVLKLCISSQTGNSPSVRANVKFLHTPEGTTLTLYMISRIFLDAFLCFANEKYLRHNQLTRSFELSAAFGITESIQ